MTLSNDATRLVLLTPPRPDPVSFPGLLRNALSAGDVAAVLIALAEGGSAADALAAELVPLVQSAGAAAIIAEDTRVAGRLKADGVHVSTGPVDLRAAVDSFGGKRTVGAGNIHSRHSAMDAAEIGADYIFFGRLHGDTHDAPHPKALELAAWWSEVTEVPAILMAGRSLAGIAEAAASGIAFLALNDAVWTHAGGPAAAVAEAHAALGGTGRRAA